MAAPLPLDPFDPEDPLKFERLMIKPRKPLGWAHTAALQCEWKYMQVWAQIVPKGTRKLPELLAQIPIVLTPVKLPPVSQPTPTASLEVLLSTMLRKTKFRPVCRWFSANMLASAEWTTVTILPHFGVALKDSGHKKPLQWSELEMDLPFLSAKPQEKSWIVDLQNTLFILRVFPADHFWTGS